ncbi:loganic acid O-methyltransferase-like [Juglans microcarpa x Juglans regia]|uniref:loganic acid O-methyltransferase-like n=1 Tax=Juglans microcarpa x Juglans regia TaxID=2249226 RepID=UPI001B7E9DF2|nr:loganic acid O-methyltransferase-like [Juglans microcarpa x Juglans regia]
MGKSIAMNGGEGPNSYTHNSKQQRKGSDRAKVLLSNCIQEKLTVENKLNTANQQIFRIADLGCSVGPNTFASVQTIIEATELTFKTQILENKPPEFQVFFNDHVGNDFNTLFKALPLDRQYMAVGVPGSFHGRLFPKASMNFMHSSFALHWLTKVPEEVTVENSSAWNKGRISYVGSSSEVVKAYTEQFVRDMESFFRARAVELTSHGLMAILMPCRPEGTLPSESIIMQVFEVLGCALTDMAKEGLVSEALVDSFNLPIFIPTGNEVKEVLSNIEHLTIEKSEEINYPPNLSNLEDVRLCIGHVRAVMEGILCEHFGAELLDQLFERYSNKVEQFSKTSVFTRIEKLENLFLLLKRNPSS